MKLGLCGTGLMGTAIAQRLLTLGMSLRVWNRDPGKVAKLIRAGAVSVETPADLSGSDGVLLCLRDADAVESVMFGPGGLVHATSIGWIADHSTIDPSKARNMAARLGELGLDFIDAPLSGGPARAAQGELTAFVGGPNGAVERIRPILGSYVARLTHAGDHGAGQTLKLCNQTIASTTLAAIAEALVLCEKSGIAPAIFIDAAMGGWADSPFFRAMAPRMVDRPEDVFGSISMMLKDLTAISRLSSQVGASTVMSAATLQVFEAAMSAGLGEQDISQVVTALRR